MRMIRLTSGVDSQVLLCDLNSTIACPQVDVVNHGHWLDVWFRLSYLRDECIKDKELFRESASVSVRSLHEDIAKDDSRPRCFPDLGSFFFLREFYAI